MSKPLLVATLLLSTASIALAQAASAPEPKVVASAPKKHKYFHAPKLRPGATPAVNPEATPDKKGGQ